MRNRQVLKCTLKGRYYLRTVQLLYIDNNAQYYLCVQYSNLDQLKKFSIEISDCARNRRTLRFTLIDRNNLILKLCW